MTIDPATYDRYEICSPDGTQLLATANTYDEGLVAAVQQLHDGHVGCTVGLAGFEDGLLAVATRTGSRYEVKELRGSRWVPIQGGRCSSDE